MVKINTGRVISSFFVVKCLIWYLSTLWWKIYLIKMQASGHNSGKMILMCKQNISNNGYKPKNQCEIILKFSFAEN